MPVLNISNLFGKSIKGMGESTKPISQEIKGQHIEPITQRFMENFVESSNLGLEDVGKQKSFSEITALNRARKKMSLRMEKHEKKKSKKILFTEYKKYFSDYFSELSDEEKIILGELNLNNTSNEESLLFKIETLLDKSKDVDALKIQELIIKNIEEFINKNKILMGFNPYPIEGGFTYKNLVKEIVDDTELAEKSLLVKIKFNFDMIKAYQKQYAKDILKLYLDLKKINALKIDDFISKHSKYSKLPGIASLGEMDTNWHKLFSEGMRSHIEFTKSLGLYIKTDLTDSFNAPPNELVGKLEFNTILIDDIIPTIKSQLKTAPKGSYRKQRKKRTRIRKRKDRKKTRRKRASQRKNWRR